MRVREGGRERGKEGERRGGNGREGEKGREGVGGERGRSKDGGCRCIFALHEIASPVTVCHLLRLYI